MGFDIVRGVIKNAYATQQLIEDLNRMADRMEINGTLFLGYPLSAAGKDIVSVDALLICQEKGIIAFIFNQQNVNQEEEQDILYYQLSNMLSKYNILRTKRKLAIEPNVVTFYPTSAIPKSTEEYIYCNSETIERTIKELPEFDSKWYLPLCETLLKISSMKPKKKRGGVQRENSYGGIIKKIEAEIANLDEWQKKAAFEIPEGPQRIRGLAGSGKTVVLALKAAYLHSQHPSWHIAVTFYTRALAQQYKEMITNFSYEFMGEQPDWDRLHILHAWGTASEPGVYSEIAGIRGVVPKTYAGAKAQYGVNGAFEGICKEVLFAAEGREEEILYDAILIDEAQDLPAPFFKLCYAAVAQPKRIIFAYDELQSLNSTQMPGIDEMFGKDENGNSRVKLLNHEGEARQDIVLPVCYRNTPWALALAHALGFGIYREGDLVQLFDDMGLWNSIGYKVIGGEAKFGQQVRLARRDDSYPAYFKELLRPEDAIQIRSFGTVQGQYHWAVSQIEHDIKENELDPDDILVIFPDAYYAKNQYNDFQRYLDMKGISSILAGVTANRDTFRIPGHVTCSSIYRAKGNEAPMVYILNTEYCARGSELITLRNKLFTAITRSRAWIRICGVNPEMEILQREAEKCVENHFELDFKIPTQKELEKSRLLYRDRSEGEKKKIKSYSNALNQIIASLEAGEVNIDLVPELGKLLNAVEAAKEAEGEDE